MADDFEMIPGGGGIQYQEYSKFLKAEDFTYTDENGDDIIIAYDMKIREAYIYYFDIWDNCREYGLPESNWSENPEWLTKFVKVFNRVFADIEAYRVKKGR